MKRRIVSLLAATVLALSMTACGNGLPDYTTQDAYDLGIEAYECMEDFCNGSMNENTLEEKLSDIYADLEDIESDHEKNDESSDYINDGSIALSVNLALSELRVMDEGETYGIENARDELAEKLELN